MKKGPYYPVVVGGSPEPDDKDDYILATILGVIFSILFLLGVYYWYFK